MEQPTETDEYYKTPSDVRLYKKLYYMSNKDQIKEENLNSYYMKKYGKTREQHIEDKKLQKRLKLIKTLNDLSEKNTTDVKLIKKLNELSAVVK